MIKKNNWILNLILVLMITTFSLTGCKFFASSKLKTPIVTLNKNANSIGWEANYDASKFEVYMNESKIADVEIDSDKTQYTYVYTDDVGQFGEYRFQVKAIGSGKYADSDLSEAVTVKVGTASKYLDKNTTLTRYLYDSQYAPQNVKVENSKIKWTKPNRSSEVDTYLVSIYTNSLGIIDYEINSNELIINSDMMSGNDIMAIKVSAVVDGYNYESKDLCYYNPLDNNRYGKYTDTIYVFDGEIYDYYIENWNELQNLYYYAFIYRIENLSFMVANDFYNEYEDTYFATSSYDEYKADEYIVGYAYFETYGFAANGVPHLSEPFKISSASERCFNLTCDFTVEEPSLTGVGASTPMYTQDDKYEPYYNTVNYEKRAEDYDDFADNNWFLSTEVSTSEELFWAVSTHVKPIIKDTDSRAYIIYEKAKDVLREIISDDMTDYEKVLSIFDYIMVNTTYDHNAFTQGKNINPMQFMCYYLEAVFMADQSLSVCDGYSKAFALLCNMEGINCVRVVGTAGISSEGGHAWNKVEIAGNWYVVDITWTEMQGSSSGITHLRREMAIIDGRYQYYLERYSNLDEEESTHMYFLLSDEDIKDSHHAFKNRYIYDILECPEIYGYYEVDYLTIGDKTYSRVIENIEELTAILDNCLKNNYSGVEVVIAPELFNQAKYDGEILNILKDAKYSFSALSYFVNMIDGEIVFVEEGIDFNGGKVYYERELDYAGITYNAEGDVGILLLIRVNVSLTTNQRIADYVEFVKNNKVTTQDRVQISKSKIYEILKTKIDVTQLNGYIPTMTNAEKDILLTSYIDSLKDEQRLNILEEYFETLLSGSDVKDVSIVRTAEDVVKFTNTQNEMGEWELINLTLGEFTIQYVYE